MEMAFYLYFMRCKPSARPPLAVPDSVGYVLFSAVTMNIAVGEQRMVPTGIRVKFSTSGHYVEFMDLPEMAMRGLQVVNLPVVNDDSEIQLLIRNFGRHTFRVRPGTRLAEMVLMRTQVHDMCLKEVSEWPEPYH